MASQNALHPQNMPRPKNSTISSIEEKRLARERMRERVHAVQDKLINAQIAVALGSSELYRVDTDDKGNRKRPVLVTDEEEIKRYLAGDCDRDDSTYYYIFTKQPDTKAIDSLLDRALGRASTVEKEQEDMKDMGVILYPSDNMDELDRTDDNNLLEEGAEPDTDGEPDEPVEPDGQGGEVV